MNFSEVSQHKQDDSGDRPRIPKTFRLNEYQYTLPSCLIAQQPAPSRDSSRLLVLDRSKDKIEHCCFRDLPSLLLPSDLLVLNETRVVPTVMTGQKTTGGRVEILVLDPTDVSRKFQMTGQAARECLVRSSKSLKQGSRIIIQKDVELVAEEIVGKGRVRIRFPVSERDLPFFLDQWGRPPLPPYISRVGRDHSRDRVRYQTVYARIPGSVAAPTAGLHFTQELLSKLATQGVETVPIVLHVGPGTFVPVRDDDIRLHSMESEYYEIPDETADALSKAYEAKRRIIAVGTTTVRTLESAAEGHGIFRVGPSMTALFITSGYDFRVVTGMVTNFHLPGSTLFMLVCAFAGTERVKNAYEQAIRHGYRFYSYGDACLII
jgi:S-adenosylmethionine:tRNA ribosyltransferase-isomerase